MNNNEINYINGYEIADAEARASLSTVTSTLQQASEQLSTQSHDIQNLESQVLALASGSPLVASSTDEMTDTTRTYVNTTDGHWYYYDGTEWQDGGEYQAAEDSETVQEIENWIEGRAIPEATFVQGNIGSDGADVSTVHYIRTSNYIPKENDCLNYEVNTGYTIRFFAYSGTVGNYTFISQSATLNSTGKYYYPEGTTFIRYAIHRTDTSTGMNVSEASNALVYFDNELYVRIENLESDVAELKKVVEITGTTFENAGLDFVTGEELDTDNKIRRSSYIPINNAVSVLFNTTSAYQVNFFFYKENGNSYDFIKSYSAFVGINEEIEIPKGTTHFRYTIRKGGSSSIDTSVTKMYFRYNGTPAYLTLPSYLDEEIENVKKLINANSELDSVIYAVMGDVHYVNNYESAPAVNRQFRAMKKLADECIFDFTVQIGDLLTGSGLSTVTQDYMLQQGYDTIEKVQKLMSMQRVPFIQSKGDHDSNRHYNSSQDYELTLSEWNKRIYPFITKYPNISRPSNKISESFVFDIPDKKTRIVNIDSGTQNTSINGVVLKEVITTSEMYNWLVNDVFSNDYKDDWQYIILTHVPCDNEALPTLTARYQNITTMCNALNNQTSWTYDNTLSGATESSVSATKDFTNWTSKVKIISSGHYHCSRFAKNNSNIVLSYSPSPATNGAKSVSTYEGLASRCSGLNWNTDDVRIINTVNEAAFDIFIVNSNNIKRIRFGNLGATSESGYGNGLIDKVTTINL